MNFAQKLKEIKEINGISNYKLAKDINVSQTTVANWLNGKSVPNIDTCNELVKYFKVNIDYFQESEQKETRPQLNERALEMLQHPSDELKMILELFPQLPLERQKAILDLVDAWKPQEQECKK